MSFVFFCCFFLFCRVFLSSFCFSLFVFGIVLFSLPSPPFSKNVLQISLLCFLFFFLKNKMSWNNCFLPLPRFQSILFFFHYLLLFLFFLLNAFSNQKRKFRKMILFITLVETPPEKCFCLPLRTLVNKKKVSSLCEANVFSLFSICFFCIHGMVFALLFKTLPFIFFFFFVSSSSF